MDSNGLILDAIAPLGGRWSRCRPSSPCTRSVTTMLASCPGARRTWLGSGWMQEVIHDVVRRLGREPTVSIELVTETAVALYLHSLGQQGLGFGSLDPRQLVESVLPQVILALTRELD